MELNTVNPSSVSPSKGSKCPAGSPGPRAANGMADSPKAKKAYDVGFMKKMDLVKRHLMYAVREEVEILKQQIGDMMERIGQLEYENTVLRSEAKPETLNKLLLPRSAASVTAAGGAQAQPAGVVAQPPISAGQQTTAAMLAPQQQTAPSGTSTPTPQQQQHQVSAQQPGPTPMS